MERIRFKDEYLSPIPYITVRTSGSTGTPKEIQLQKSLLAESARRTNNFFGINSESRLHSAISDEFIGGKMMVVRSIEAHCRFTWEIPSMQPLKNLTDKSAIDLLAVVPSQMWGIISNEYPIPELRNIIIGGAPIADNLRERLYDLPFKCWETYGMTETASHIALKEISPAVEYFTTLRGVSVTVDNRDCLVINDNGREIITNDVAELFSSTEFRILGRYDNMIISGAKKINPLEIENEISKLTSFPLYISSRKDDKWGEALVVVIEKKNQVYKDFVLDWERIKSQLSDILPGWKIPKDVVVIESFETTPTGTLIRRKF